MLIVSCSLLVVLAFVDLGPVRRADDPFKLCRELTLAVTRRDPPGEEWALADISEELPEVRHAFLPLDPALLRCGFLPSRPEAIGPGSLPLAGQVLRECGENFLPQG